MEKYNIFDSLLKWRSVNVARVFNKDKNYQNIESMATEDISAKPVHTMKDSVLKIDGEYHNYEFQTGKIKQKDLRRFFLYHVTLMNRYQTEKIHSTIIYTEKIKKTQTCKSEQSFFKPTIRSLKEFNGDKILNNIKTKIKNNQKIDEDDELHLSMLPLYETKRNIKELLYEVCSITNQTQGTTEENLNNIKTSQLMLVDRFIKNNEEKKKYLEEIKMKSESLELLIEEGRQEGIEKGKLEGIEKGKLEGIQEGKLEGKLEGIKDTKFDITRNMLKANMPTSKIMEFTGLSKNEIESLK